MSEEILTNFEKRLKKLSDKVGSINIMEIKTSVEKSVEATLMLSKLQVTLSSFNILESMAKTKYESCVLMGNSQLAREARKALDEVRATHDEFFSYAKNLRV